MGILGSAVHRLPRDGRARRFKIGCQKIQGVSIFFLVLIPLFFTNFVPLSSICSLTLSFYKRWFDEISAPFYITQTSSSCSQGVLPCSLRKKLLPPTALPSVRIRRKKKKIYARPFKRDPNQRKVLIEKSIYFLDDPEHLFYSRTAVQRAPHEELHQSSPCGTPRKTRGLSAYLRGSPDITPASFSESTYYSRK